MSERWHRHFLQLALDHARMSKDPSTKIGAIIVGPDNGLRSAGFNGFPRGIADTPTRLLDRATKLRLIVHGEMNAILAAAKIGVPLDNCTMYMAGNDAAVGAWGGVPCTQCTIQIIQVGIKRIISWPITTAPLRWQDNLAKELLAEAGVEYLEIAV